VEFGIVFFDTEIVQFPSNGVPTRADSATKFEAARFIGSIWGGSGSCCLPGLAAGLELAARSRAERKLLIFVGDGGGTCQGAIESVYLREARREIEASNTSGVEIHCMDMLSHWAFNVDFMRKLAWDNGGSYTRIVR